MLRACSISCHARARALATDTWGPNCEIICGGYPFVLIRRSLLAEFLCSTQQLSHQQQLPGACFRGCSGEALRMRPKMLKVQQQRKTVKVMLQKSRRMRLWQAISPRWTRLSGVCCCVSKRTGADESPSLAGSIHTRPWCWGILYAQSERKQRRPR